MSLPRRWRNMSRIYRRMGTSRQGDKATGRLGKWCPTPRLVWIGLLLSSLLLLSCTSVRPVVKIGLLAPFEGLHRRNGYIALTAMRQAIAEMAPAAVAIMPLAVDDGADPAQVERAARKLLQDPDVRALVGPYSPPLAQQIQSLLAAKQVAWWLPFAVTPADGFVVPTQQQEWAEPLLAAAAEKAVALGCQRLLLAGWTPGWPTVTAAQQTAFAIPVLLSEQVTAVVATDAVFWLGPPEAGAAYLTSLRAAHPNVPLLLGPQADDPIFAEYTQISGPVYLLFWIDDGYAQWRQQNAQPPTAYLTYRATQQAIGQLLGQPTPQPSAWRIEVMPIDKGDAP